MKKKILACAAIAAALAVGTTGALPGPHAGAQVLPGGPVMGYNTWYQYRTSVTQDDVLAQARALAVTGLAADGYTSVDIDDGWAAAHRTPAGAITWNTAQFPNGIPWLASQVHAMGLKLGIYTGIGTQTCQHLPGSYGHYGQDAATFAGWGVDLVKVDQCGGLPAGTTQAALTADYQQFGTDLRRDNPAVTYSAELPTFSMGRTPASYYTPAFVSEVSAVSSFANLWGVSPNLYPLTHAFAVTAVIDHLQRDSHLHGYAGTSRGGHWNDLDMVAPGMPSSGWTLGDLRNQLSVWAEEASPLLISGDLTAMPAAEVAALGNPYLVSTDQSGAQASGTSSGSIDILTKPYPGGGQAVLLANVSTTSSESARFTLAQAGISAARASGYNVWENRTTTFSGISVALGPGQTALLIIRPL